MKNIIKQALLISIVMLVLCGIIYPAVVTGFGQILFNKQANGSMIELNGKTVGSELIGQNFTDERYFHGRVSSVNYNTYKESDTKANSNGKIVYSGVASGSENLGPSNKKLTDRINKDIDEFLKKNTTIKKSDLPVDLFTSSGSGLDPEISVMGAKVQIPLISKTTGISEKDLQEIVSKNTTGRSLGVFGEERVNVLKVNLEISKKL